MRASLHKGSDSPLTGAISGNPMSFDFLSFVAHGLMPLPWWGYIVVALALTHVTIAAVTIYLHRHSAHRALDLHPVVSHFFRFWLWLTTGMVTKEWTAIHRKHHAKVETAEDPHSPQTRGIREVLLRGAELYRAEAKNRTRWTDTARARPTTGSSATSTRATRGKASA